MARKRGVQPSFRRRGFTAAPALGDEDDHAGYDGEGDVEQEKEENSNSSNLYRTIALELKFRWGVRLKIKICLHKNALKASNILVCKEVLVLCTQWLYEYLCLCMPHVG